ncbi:MAG: cytochrome b/b6 domain-containing protein [Candidatus Micrarchaeia archaeon]|jgi:Ni,Fe-hydrogenase I cytochrome b subunit
MKKPMAQKAVHILITLCILLYLLTGFGITNYQIVQPLTLGLLPKALSQQIHMSLALPFIILLILHIYFAWIRKPDGK